MHILHHHMRLDVWVQYLYLHNPHGREVLIDNYFYYKLKIGSYGFVYHPVTGEPLD